jgi:hypothetical protein
MRANVDRRVTPVDQLAIHPDLLRLKHLRLVPSVEVLNAESYPDGLNIP